MAFPTSVNDQITDSVTQANVLTLGQAPTLAMGAIYQATALAISNAAHNATSNQQQANILAQAIVTTGVALIYGKNIETSIDSAKASTKK